MKKRNVFLQTTIASAMLVLVGAASAGQVTAVNTKYASEVFKAATTLQPGAVSYNYQAPNGNINANGVVYFQIRLTGATMTTAPTTGDFTVAGLSGTGAATATNPGFAILTSSDKTTAQVTVTAPTGAGLALGVNALVWTPSATSLTVPASFATVGSTIQAQLNFSSTSAGATAAALDSSNALPASADGTTAPVAIATSGQAISGVVSNLTSGATPYGVKIDLTAAPAGSAYTSGATGLVSLGSVTFTDSTTAWKDAPAAAATYNIAGKLASGVLVVTPGAGQSFPVGATISYDVVSSTCTGTQYSPVTVTPANAATAKTLTLTVGATGISTGQAMFVCMTKPTAPNLATPITATLTATTVPTTSATENGDVATGTGYPLTYNGAAVTLRNYIPAAVTGYLQTARVINTGKIAAPVSVSLIDEAGNAGPSVVIIPSLAAGATARLTQSQIETAVGAQAASARPQLRFTAPTDAMQVQSFFNNANGAYTNLAGSEQ